MVGIDVVQEVEIPPWMNVSIHPNHVTTVTKTNKAIVITKNNYFLHELLRSINKDISED